VVVVVPRVDFGNLSPPERGLGPTENIFEAPETRFSGSVIYGLRWAGLNREEVSGAATTREQDKFNTSL
jgi:hypothetical protein